MALKENYKDDILDTSQNVKRKYQMENNGDGTVSFTDVTEYTQQGDSFGASDMNAITHFINNINLDALQCVSYNSGDTAALANSIDAYIAQANMSDNTTQNVILKTTTNNDYRYSFIKIGGASTVISPFSTTMTIPQLMASQAGASKDGSLNCSINVTNFKTIKIGTMALNCPYGAVGSISLSGNNSGTLKSANNSTGVTYSNLTYNIANDTKLTFYGYSASVSGNNGYVKFANIELIP